MDFQILEPILGGSPVTKTWFSMVLGTTVLDFFSIVDVQKHIHFLNPEDIFKRPLDALLSFCYPGKLSLYSAVSLYNTLMILRNLDTHHMRSGREFVLKMALLLMYVYFVFYVGKYTLMVLIDNFQFKTLKPILDSLKNAFVVLSLWEVITMNLIYYGYRFQGVADFNGWFNIHPVFLFLLNLTPFAFSSMWPLSVMGFLPGHMLFFIDQIVPKLNENLPFPTKISQKTFANCVIFVVTVTFYINQFV